MLLVILGFGAVIAIVEPDVGTPWDGIWWAFVTTTTVGSGDIAPESVGGRIVAMMLMLMGIALLGVFTGLVASYFVEEDEQELEAEVMRIHSRLDAIEAALGIAPSSTNDPSEPTEDNTSHP
jgi:voltage-gated potassium channel